MQSEQQDPAEQAPAAQPAVVPLEDFRAVELEEPIREIDQVDCHSLESRYSAAAHAAQAAGNETKVRVYGLVAALCGFYFKVEDKAGAFGPLMVLADGKRTAVPDDFRGAQSDVLNQIVAGISHPGLRARIADVVWINDRSRADAAKLAIDAYCEAFEKLEAGEFKDRFDGKLAASFEKIGLIQRALQIVHATTRRGNIPQRAIDNVMRLYQAAKNGLECVAFARVAELRLFHELGDPSAIAGEAEALAATAAAQSKTYPLAIKNVLALAAEAYRRCGDKDASRRCELASVDQTLAMRQQVSGAGAEASWVRTAINELRSISETVDQRNKLRDELRLLQERSLDDYRLIEFPLEVDDIRDATAKHFEGQTLSTALLSLAALTGSRPIADLRDQAIKNFESAPLSSLFGQVFTDEEGKIVAESPSEGVHNASEDKIKSLMSRHHGMWRQLTVAGSIDPARNAIMRRYSVTERHLMGLATMSPFAPDTHAYTYALGFARFLQGDFVSAGHLLVPQLEHSLRYVLRSAGQDASKFVRDTLQEDRTLSTILEVMKPQLDDIFTPDIINEIDLLFNYKPGPALRHAFAHGKVAAGACFGADVIYACWFIYRLTCLPLFPYWSEHVAVTIDDQVS